MRKTIVAGISCYSCLKYKSGGWGAPIYQIISIVGIVIALFGCAMPPSQPHRSISGSDLQSLCKARIDSEAYLSCLYYVGGVHDTLTNPSLGGLRVNGLCIPPGTSLNELSQVVVDYLRDRPQLTYFRAETLVVKSWEAAYPCE